MINKILVEMYVPAIGQSYDVFIPLAVSMYDVLKMASASMTELSGGKFKATDTTALCDAQSGEIYNINASVQEIGLKNGSRLMLI